MRTRSSKPVNRVRTFEQIYQRNTWNGDGTRAGPGSSMRATEHLREALLVLLSEIGCRSFLDAACGDSLWMPAIPGYVGVDIVEEAVRVARERHPTRMYLVADICQDTLPEVDVVFCRDAMQHLSFADAFAALKNFRRTGARWLLASSHTDGVNRDIATGRWYPINMEAPPFELGEPFWFVPDGTWDTGVRYPTKIMGLWWL